MTVPRLSVVLITRDLEWNIGRLIDSVLRETAGIPAEIVVVDSASGDRTVEIAATRPVQVVRLAADQVLTAAAGRHVGFHRTTGDLVLFLDGDMELAPGWLPRALEVLEREPEVAVVSGPIIDLPRDAAGAPPLEPVPDEAPRELPYTAGAALHRRAVLDAVGTFNPYLKSDEEPELCLRIGHAGHRIVALAHPLAYHYSDPFDALSTIVARWKRGLYLGAGQSIRYHLRTGMLGLYVRERGYGLIPGVALAGGATALGRGVGTGRWMLFGGWTMLVATVVGGDVVRRGNARVTAHSLLERMCIFHGTVRGFLMPAPDPAEYPARYDVVKEKVPA